MIIKYNKEFLISELKRFYKENGRVPTQKDMSPKNGYPNGTLYRQYFDSYNKALEITKLKPNRIHHVGTLDGTEVCSYCGKRADEIPNFVHWLYPDGIRYCTKHGSSNYEKFPAYVIGKLDINSPKGLGRAGEILVVETLGIGNEYDCNRISCGYSFDMYHDEYGKIDVKTGLFNYEYNSWGFPFKAKKEADTYICISLSYSGKYVQHVWVVPNEGKIRDLINFTVYDTQRSLSNREHWEVLSKPYNDVWQEMIVNYQIGKCKIFK